MWPVFVAPCLGLAASVGLQVIFVVALVLPAALRGRAPDADEITSMLFRPWMTIGLLASGQLCFAAVTVVAAVLSRERFRQRLGLVNPSLPWWGWIAIPVGAWFPAALGLLLGWPLPSFFGQGAQFVKLWETIAPSQAVAFVAAIALLPGLFEELLFRGYVQRRLLQRWKPALAIGVTSAIFASFHFEPSTVVFAFPIGCWLGVIAWRTGSVLPGIAAHTFINGSWNVFQILSRQNILSERAQGWTIGIALVAATLAFAATWRIIGPGRRASTHRSSGECR